MMQRNNVRRACKSDAAAIAEIERECFSVPWSESAILDTMQTDTSVFLVCENEGRTVGYIGSYSAASEGYITNVAVLKDFRRRGIARALIEALADEGKRQGLKFWTLEVRESNEGAIALYGSLGFERVGLRPRYYSNPEESAVLMTLYI